MSEELFDSWNIIKKETEKIQHRWTIKNREIYWVKIGYNIGYESYGKDKEFLRPVVVLKKFSNELFLGIPLTSKIKDSRYYFNFFPMNKQKQNSAMLSQVKVFSTKRIKRKFGKIDKDNFLKMKELIL
jgi:mRNA interferase MazF